MIVAEGQILTIGPTRHMISAKQMPTDHSQARADASHGSRLMATCFIRSSSSRMARISGGSCDVSAGGIDRP